MSTFLKPIATILSDAFQDFKKNFESAHTINQFLRRFGWLSDVGAANVSSIYSLLNIDTLITSVENIVNDIENQNSDEITLVTNLVSDIKSLFSTVKGFTSIGTSLSVFPFNQSGFWSQMGDELPNYIIATTLNKRSPGFYGVLTFFGIISKQDVALTSTGRVNYSKYDIDWSKLFSVITNPGQRMSDEYGWNTIGGIDSKKLLSNLDLLIRSLKLSSRIIYPYDDVAQNYYTSTYRDQNNVRGVDLRIINSPVLSNDIGYLLLGVHFLPIPNPPLSSNNPTGFVISPIVQGSYSGDIKVNDDFYIVLKDSFNLSNAFQVEVFPNKTSITLATGVSEIDASMYLVGKPQEPWLLIGTPGETRIELPSFTLGVEVGGVVDDIEIKVKISSGDETTMAPISIYIEPGSGDSFIKKILGEDPLLIQFEGSLIWSSKTGLGFNGNIGFSFEMPIHASLGPLTIESIKVSPSLQANTVNVGLGIDFSLDVGPLHLVVSGIGAKLLLENNTSGSTGILSNLDLDWAFKSPTGLGISIEADPVSGGGFLNYDESTYTYTGALQLKFSKISLNAIGILTTRMPDGSDGYSLLIIITADFTPIQLGMGFTLNGVGGLLGLNRTMNTDRLRSGVKDGSLDYILFPQNVVANANTIISNLGQAFPVQQGQFLIGPMAKIGWGTPTLLTIELGIIIEMPSPVVLAILGVIKAVLPSDTNRILAIQVNFLGIIDFSKKYLSFDASLYDSKILTFGLVGDMALRLYWGDNPAFLLSVGGFHPKYTPPPAMNLPAMQRLAIILANDSNLKINVQTYFAVTSNTAQFGASVSAMAHAWKIQAVGAVWFDVLFQFSPFHFMADMGAMFAIKMGSSTILSIYVDLSLEGPNPWRAQGKASFKIVFVRVHVSFDKTFGQASVDNIAPVQVMPQLQSAIGNKDNWQVIGPDRSHEVVTFRQISVGSGQLVDPFGSLQLSQKIVPLGVTIGKFGNSKASDDNSFSIGAVTSGAISFPTGTLRDYFAPSSFFFLSDDQKLSRASYELYNSGVSIGNTDAVVADYCVSRQLGYEDIIVDTRQRFRLSAFAALSSAEYAMHTAYNYVSDSKYSTFSGRVPPSGPGKVSMNTATSYVVADKNSLGQVGSVSFGNYTEASLHLDSLRVTDPNAGNYAVMNAFELN